MARYLGGLITADESLVIPADNYGDTSAPGVWTLAEAELLNKSNRWPTAGNTYVTQQIGLFFGGQAGAGEQNYIDQRNLASTGNATDFGDMSAGKQQTAALGNNTRAVVGGGYT
jgi:hypothetical protein